MLNANQIQFIVSEIGIHFRTFGGGQVIQGNPISHALKDKPLSFAASVDVTEVVLVVLGMAEKLQKEDD